MCLDQVMKMTLMLYSPSTPTISSAIMKVLSPSVSYYDMFITILGVLLCMTHRSHNLFEVHNHLLTLNVTLRSMLDVEEAAYREMVSRVYPVKINTLVTVYCQEHFKTIMQAGGQNGNSI